MNAQELAEARYFLAGAGLWVEDDGTIVDLRKTSRRVRDRVVPLLILLGLGAGVLAVGLALN